MGFPEGAQTVVLTGHVALADGQAQRDTITLTPSVPRIVSTALDFIVEGDPITVIPDRSTGMWTVRLLATDASGFNPTGWTYQVKQGDDTPYSISLAAATTPVDLSNLAPVTADPGIYDVVVPVSSLGTAATKNVGTAAGTVAAGDDARLSDSRTPTGSAGGDLSGTYPNPTVAKVGGVAVSGTAANGKVLTASSSSAASWQTPAGGGGGSTIRTAAVRITDDDLSGLPSASSWAVVLTSASTPLQASITAAAGDRIRVCGRFMRNGAHFLDWVLLDSAGAIRLYATSESGTAPTEGNPSMYPSLSFSPVTGEDMFTVASGDVDGSGKVTVALAHQGTASGIVYAHATYPWRLRLENIGPEPA